MISLVRHLTAATVLVAPLADEPEAIDFGTLSDFEYVEGMELPSHVTSLDGKRVEVAGFMKREDGGEGDTDEFMLVNDACGCNGMPFLNEIVFCTMPDGETTSIQPGIVSVTGTLYVGEVEDGGYVVSLYTMDVETVGD